MVVKSLQKEVWLSSLGIKRGIGMLPFNNLSTTIPAVTATKMTANPMETADVYLKESVTNKIQIRSALLEIYEVAKTQVFHESYSVWGFLDLG